jgi:hypothetical protein
MKAAAKTDWRQTARKVAALVSGVEVPLDRGIKDTVIVLNALGYKTIGSCAGHLDHGTGGPWVHLAVDDADILDTRLRSKRPKVSRVERFWIANRVRHVSNSQLRGLRHLVNDFYKGRRVRPDVKIRVYNPAGGFVILESRGVNNLLWRDLLEPRYSAKNLHAYQAEMKDLTKFLKTKV